MIKGELERRVYLIGDRPQLVVHSDCQEALEAVEIRCTAGSKKSPDEGAVHIFILGGRSAELAPIEIPPDASNVFVTRYVVIKSDNSHRYGDWYGKAETVTDLTDRRAVISIPSIGYFNRDFVSRMVFRPVLDRLLFECGFISLHAAGVVSGETGCIIAGNAGAGKSTLLYGLLEEIRKTTSMRSLYLEISSILEKHGFRYIPLKGCDPRIYSGARDFFNVMDDVNILVKYTDIENIGGVLEESGYIYQGTINGSHLNFFTDEKIPRLIEIHWDLINRNNPIHRRLFRASIERIWERSSVLCAVSHLSLEDLLSYLTSHCVKEYFHKPKWLADIAWVISNYSDEMDPVTSKEVIREWGTSKALGIIASALNTLLCDSIFDVVWNLGAERPGFAVRYLSGRLLYYEKLRNLRPLIVTASASSLPRALTVSAGVIERCIRGR